MSKTAKLGLLLTKVEEMHAYIVWLMQLKDDTETPRALSIALDQAQSLHEYLKNEKYLLLSEVSK